MKTLKLQSYQNFVSSLILSGSGLLVLLILKFLCPPDISANYLVQYSFAGLMIILDLGFGLSAQRVLSRDNKPRSILNAVSRQFWHQYLVKILFFISFYYFILSSISTMNAYAVFLGSLLPISYFVQCILKGSEQYDQLRFFNLQFALINIGSVLFLVSSLNVTQVLFIQASALCLLLAYTLYRQNINPLKRFGDSKSEISISQTLLLAPQLFSGILSVHGMRLLVEKLYGAETLVNFSLIYSISARLFQICVSMYEPILNNFKRLNKTESVLNFGLIGLIKPIIVFASCNFFLVILYLILEDRDVWVTVYFLFCLGMILNLATSPILLFFNYEGELNIVFIATLALPTLYFCGLYLVQYVDDTIVSVGSAYFLASLLYSVSISIVYFWKKYAN